MKQINLKNAEIKELVISGQNISILYLIKDDLNVIIFEKRISITKDELPVGGQNAMDNLLEKLLAKVVLKEEL